MNPHRLRAYFLLLVVAVIWGAAGSVIKFTLEGITPLLFLTYRFAISAAIALIFLIVTGAKFPKERSTQVEMIVYGLFSSTVGLGLLFIGLEKTTVLDMTLISAVGPLLIALAGALILKEHITKRERFGMMIAFMGSLITIIKPLVSGNTALAQLQGNVLVIAYLLIFTSTAIMAKRLLRKGVSSLTLTNYTFIIGFITILPLALIKYGISDIIQIASDLSFPFHLGVMYMAVLSGNLAYTLWAKGQKTIEVSEAALFSYFNPLFSAPLAVLWLKESITTPFMAGAILITTGVIIAEYKNKRKAQS